MRLCSTVGMMSLKELEVKKIKDRIQYSVLQYSVCDAAGVWVAGHLSRRKDTGKKDQDVFGSGDRVATYLKVSGACTIIGMQPPDIRRATTIAGWAAAHWSRPRIVGHVATGTFDDYLDTLWTRPVSP